MQTGIVTRVEGPGLWVDLDQGEIWCVLRGRLKKQQIRVSSPVVIGDRVSIEVDSSGTGAVVALEPRASELARPGYRGVRNVVAANLDGLIIVTSAHQPPFKRRLVDRFLVTARRGAMEPLLVVNKCDLEQEPVIRAWTQPLVDAGVKVILTSAVNALGVEDLRQAISGRLSALAGQSGVGKSSLVTAMLPHTAIRTAEVSARSHKGRHTTTASRLYRLPGGGYLADTPGIRSLALFDDDHEEAVAVFPEIVALASGCRFRDCSHTHEPECAVKAAVSAGALAGATYDSYVHVRRRG